MRPCLIHSLKQHEITMIWKAVILLGSAVCVLGDAYAISEQKVITRSKPHQGQGQGHHGDLKHSHKPEHHEEYEWSYPSYEFYYMVEDPHTEDKKGQKESREGDEVKGVYWLYEPDGRKRTVEYSADKKSGFNAYVKYSGPLKHIYQKSEGRKHKPHVEHTHEENEDDRKDDDNKNDHHEDHHGEKDDKKNDEDNDKHDEESDDQENTDDNQDDKRGHSSQIMPSYLDEYRHIPNRQAPKQFNVPYPEPRNYRNNRRQF